MEDQKVVGFQFYNLWGMAENFAGHHQAAMEKFTKALRFEGDHSWALLNWGNSAFADGDLKLARKKYFESLDKTVVPMAVKGLLVTLKKQDDFIGYFDVFRKYGPALSAFEYADRSELELFALSSACRQGKAAPQSILRPGEGLLHNNKVYQRKDFNGLTCLLPS
jgi:tetratricopeptide (TPR) repeat protein